MKEIKRVKNKDLIAQVFSHVKDSEDLNETIKAVISEYEEKNGSLQYCNEKKRENGNGNGYGNGYGYGVSYPDTLTNRSAPKRKNFKKPSFEDVQTYCNESGYHIDVDRFMNYYESNGWMVGRNKMKDWKATVRNWASKEKPVSNKADTKHYSDPEEFYR